MFTSELARLLIFNKLLGLIHKILISQSKFSIIFFYSKGQNSRGPLMRLPPWHRDQRHLPPGCRNWWSFHYILLVWYGPLQRSWFAHLGRDGAVLYHCFYLSILINWCLVYLLYYNYDLEYIVFVKTYVFTSLDILKDLRTWNCPSYLNPFRHGHHIVTMSVEVKQQVPPSIHDA